ncbi:hypothetical protein [Corynebacterium alimapuense]|uniref:Uncharacterized protein n=1 Tax=Corynebacterium alimapuense TaxID=1576874 RepID=A0A3M8K6V9_9CORY|nr:hypothetical protein [Corynebacterium alimapuense]RNE48943.1 hypothetical protein C5L39_06555 [Corynebacterium alimapuense]
MGRLLLILLIIVAIVLVWKAFGPSSWKRNQVDSATPKAIKGPDDDEEFLWNIEKNHFKQRRAREDAAREDEERVRRAKQRYTKPEDSGSSAKPENDPEIEDGNSSPSED